MSDHRRLLDVVLLAFRPARWSIFGFRFVPLLLFAAGTWAVVYGGFYHRIRVTETHAEPISIAAPVERAVQPDALPGMAPLSLTDAFGQATDAFGQAADAPGPPPDVFGPPLDVFGPPLKLVQAVKTVKTTSAERELAVNRAVTVAGLIRDQQGEIMRASGAAEGPALCPT